MKTLKEIYQANEELNYIDSSLYSRYRVKAGLRNDNGTGVKVGLTKICDVIGYKFVHEKKYNIDGQLIYRGYPINYLVDKQPKDHVFGFLYSRNETYRQLCHSTALYKYSSQESCNSDRQESPP